MGHSVKMKLFEEFDYIFCINLDERKDRWNDVQEEFKKIGILDRITRFPAIKKTGKGLIKKFISYGQIGCLLSHREIIRQAKKSGARNVLVFEDDIEFIEGRKIPENLPKNPWDILYLGFSIRNGDFPYFGEENDFYSTAVGLRATHAIAYNASSFDYLLHHLPSTTEEAENFLVRWKGIDRYYARHMHDKKRSICLKKMMFQQKPDWSDIEKKYVNYQEFMYDGFPDSQRNRVLRILIKPIWYLRDTLRLVLWKIRRKITVNSIQ